jgi:hypothetical protein
MSGKAEMDSNDRRLRVLSVVVLAVLLLSSLDALIMTRVAVLPQYLAPAANSYYPCGDADLDFRFEVYGTSGGFPDTVIGYENAGGNSYQKFYPGILFRGIPCDMGDGDNDGLTELLCDSVGNDGDFTILFESEDSWSYPRSKVWQVRNHSEWLPPQYTDLDRDGHMEIAISAEGEGIKLFENAGDNRYDSVATLPTTPLSYFRCFDTSDFDNDGLCELAAGHGAYVDVFEGTGRDNEFVLSAVCTTAADTDADAARCLTAARDMDLDGYSEFILLVQSPMYDKLVIYEASSHAKYRVAWQRVFPVSTGPKWLSSGDIDGDGVDEFVYSLRGMLRVFKCTGPDEYEQVWTTDSIAEKCQLSDLNGNGRAELIFDVIWTGSPDLHCNIYEDTEGLAVAEMSKPRTGSPVKVTPTLVCLGAVARFSDLPTDADLEVHSLDGRLVRRTHGVRQSTWTWDLRDRSENLVPAGTYFAVIRCKGRTTSLKLCLVK